RDFSGQFRRNEVLALLYDHASDDGYPQNVEFYTCNNDGNVSGLLLDPLTLGVTVLDTEMVRSLRLAYRICRQHAEHEGRAHPVMAVVPDIPAQVAVLSGPSAGALFAAAMIVTARGDKIRANRTATASLQLEDWDEDTNDSQNIEPDTIGVGRVGNIREKMWSAKQQTEKLPLETVFLQEHDSNEWHSSGENWSVKVDPISTLSDLVKNLTGDTEREQRIDQHRQWTENYWNRISHRSRSTVGHSNADARVNDEYRLDCYVPPSLTVEGPRIHSEGGGDGSSEYGRSDRESAPVPGEGDVPLGHLIRLMTGIGTWGEAPGWIKLGKGLLIYDVAGAGKSVCSLKLQQLASGSDFRECFNGEVPIVVRMRAPWPTDANDKCLRLADAVAAAAKRDGFERDLNAEDVGYALKERRVLIIVDGFDEFSQEHSRHISTLFTDRDPDYRSVVDGCHWIITSRVHTIEHHAALFQEGKWNRIRIDRFTPKQQDAYFDLPPKNLTGCDPIGKRWLETVLDREAMDEQLSLPMVLREIRRLIEESDTSESDSKKDRPLPLFRTL
ncbi:MAG: hypothetical protein KDA99_20725, partial [Planctomycetales bacterium]|nr:hypothetical protein [Planctomycetales bacterium]